MADPGDSSSILENQTRTSKVDKRSNSIWASTTSINDDLFTRCGESSCDCEGKLYHCPLCVRRRIKGMKLSKLKHHFAAVHWKSRVTHLDFQFLRCYMNCKSSDEKSETDGISHYHCYACQGIYKRQDVFKNHIRKHHVQTGCDNVENASTSAQTSSSVNVSSHVSESSTVTSRNTTNFYRCKACGKDFASKKSLQNHTKYYHVSPDFISASRYLDGVCVDPDKGIYMIRRSFSGTSHPVHVMHNFGINGGFSCELNDCREIFNTAKRSGNPNFICNHLKSVQYVTKTSTSRYILQRESLEALIDKKVNLLKQSRKEECLKLQNNAAEDKSPIIAEYISSHVASTRFQHFSVYDDKIHHYSRFKRVIVSYDRIDKKWTCSCCRRKVNCVHKCVAKWFLYAERPQELLLNYEDDESDQGDSDEMVESPRFPTDDTGLRYPPQGAPLEKMVEYLHQCKRIPTKLSRDITHDLEEYPTRLVPTEVKCQYCEDVDLSEAKLITQRGKIFTTTKVIEAIQICFKMCPECGMAYRYQEYLEGLHNFDDFHCFSLSLMLFLRAFVEEHTALGRAAAVFTKVTGEKIDESILRNAYYHFEALTNHTYNFSCVLCGYYPPHLNWDLCKKGCFSLMLDDLTVPPENDESDRVNAGKFWKKVEQMHIAKGLTENLDSFTVKATYDFWAPWIGEKTRKDDVVFNTEYRKCHQITMQDVVDPSSLPSYSEEDLLDMFNFAQVNVLQKLCGQIGAKQTSRLTKHEAVAYLRSKLNVPSHFKKIFTKIWGASGGWASGSCPHNRIYAIKFVLRSEGPRDYFDLIRSFKHPPTINVSDIPNRLATFANRVEPEFFNPNNGQWFPSTQENISLANEGKLQKQLDWTYASANTYVNNNVHPVTGTVERYCLYDRFHESNSHNPADVLRHLTLCPQLHTNVNSESHEQLHQILNKDNYFLNMMNPATHVFMKRLLVDLRNERKNEQEKVRQGDAIKKHGVVGKISLDGMGRLVIHHDTNDGELVAADETNSSPMTGETSNQHSESLQDYEDTPEYMVTNDDYKDTSIIENISLGNALVPRPIDNTNNDIRGSFISILQCLATCNLVDAPGANDLSWLLYYLARPRIEIPMDCIQTKLSRCMQSFPSVADPVNILESSISSSEIIARACCGHQRIQMLCRGCGCSSESNDTPFYVVNLPCLDGRQSVESRLLDYYEHDVEANGVLDCCERRDLVQLKQPVTLPTLLICNMLPANDDGSVKDLSRTKATKKIRVYNVEGEFQIYTLSSCLVYNRVSDTEDYFSSIIQLSKKFFWVDNKSVEHRSSFEANWDEYIYLLFYNKLGQDDIDTVIVDDDCKNVVLKRNRGDNSIHTDFSEIDSDDAYSNPVGIYDISIAMMDKVKHYWNIRHKKDLHEVVSVIAANTLTWYDVKSLDDNPSELDISILQKFARDKDEIFHKGWINDKIMNSFLILLQKKSNERNDITVQSIGSFIYSKMSKYGVHSVRKYFNKQCHLQSDLCFFPINHSNQHWCLGVIDQRTNILGYYDPLGQQCLNFNKKIRLLIGYLATKECSNWPNLIELEDKAIGEPRQLDTMSCGVYVCMVADYLTKFLSTDFSQSDIPLLRKYIAAQIIDPQRSLQMSKRMHLQVNQSMNENDHLYVSHLGYNDKQKEKESNLQQSYVQTVKRFSTDAIEQHMRINNPKPIPNLISMPRELLEEIFQHVLKDGDFMILQLSLVGKYFRDIVQQDRFRRLVHFAWLRSVYDWTTASEEFVKENFLMYDIKECLQCGKNYKEMFGFIGQGKFGKFTKYYSDLDVNLINYCGIECMQS